MTESTISEAERRRMADILSERRAHGEAIHNGKADAAERRRQRLRGEPVYADVQEAIAQLDAEGRFAVSPREVADRCGADRVTVGRIMAMLDDDGDLECVSENHPKYYEIREVEAP